MKEEIYKEHHIEAGSMEYESGGWPAEATVYWEEQGHGRTCPLYHPPGKDAFHTQDEAETYAIGMAKQWIDKGKPGWQGEEGKEG
ncbi:MAG: hypothetical protein V3W10_00640 [candidate division NC10 bacterium]